MAQFGDIWGGVQEGVNADQSIVNNSLLNQANNALVQMYGPTAGNPQAALQMQNYNYLQQMNPLQVQQQGLVNTGLGLSNQLSQNTLGAKTLSANSVAAEQANTANINIAGAPQKIAANQATDTAVAANAGPQAAAQTSAATSAAQQGQVAATQAQAQQHITALATFNAAVQRAKAAGANDSDAYDAGVAAAAPIDPQGAAEHGPAQKQAYMANPSGFLAGSQNAVASNYEGMVAGMSPSARAEMLKNSVALQNQQADLVTKRQAQFDFARKQESDALNAQGTIGPALIGAQNAQDNIRVMRGLIPQMASNPVARAVNAKIQGTPEQRFEELAGSVGAALSVGEKEASGAGLSGIGRSLQEFNKIGESSAIFDLGLDTKTLGSQLDQAGNLNRSFFNAGTAKLQRENNGYAGAVARRAQAEKDLNGEQHIFDAPAAAPAPAPVGAAR